MPPPAQWSRFVVAEGAGVRLEPAAFRALAEELGDSGCALDFLGDYLRMLPGRMARIMSHLQDHDSKAAIDAVQSLRVSSAMTGVQEAEARCRVIEALLRNNQLERAFAAALSLQRLMDGLIADSNKVLLSACTELGVRVRSTASAGPQLV